MPGPAADAFVAILVQEADISAEEVEAFPSSKDPLVRRQVDDVLESVFTRPHSRR